jgi:hypothetical protein
MLPTDRRLFMIRRAQKQAKNAKTPNPSNTAELLGTSKSAKGPKSALIVHAVSIRPITAGSFNAFNDFEITTGSDYCFRNSVLLDLGSTCNIKNAESRFDLDSLRPARENEENIIFASDAIIPIISYGTIRLTVQTEGFPNSRVVTIRDTPYVPSFYTSIMSLKFLNQRGIFWSNRSNTLEWEDLGGNRRHWADTPVQYGQ